MENQEQIVEPEVKINQPNKIIILNNKWCKVESADIRYLVKLKNHLSYKTEGVEYTAAYRDHGWNGIVYLLTKSNKFPLGLLSNVLDFSKENGFEVTVEDTRAPVIVNKPINISDRLKQIGMVPRDYQERILEAAINNRIGIVRAATSSGKSLCCAMITAKLNKPTNIYVISLDLLDQFFKLFSKIFDEEIGYIGDGICNIKRINIVSIWSIGRALSIKHIVHDDEDEYRKEKYLESNTPKIINMLKNTATHIFDECHIIGTETIKAIYKNIDPIHIYGFSGTPYRKGNCDLLTTAILGEKIVDVCATELIESGVIAKPIIKFKTVPSMYNIGVKYNSIYKQYIVENSTRNKIIIDSTKELLDKGYCILILYRIIKHGEILSDMLNDEGIKFGILSGKDSIEDRQLVKDQFNAGDINVILASTIFDIGIDLPRISSLIISTGQKSFVKALQRIGRGIRSYPGKTHVAVVDFYDQAKFLKKHSIQRMEIYESEPGFKVILSKEMKKFINKNT